MASLTDVIGFIHNRYPNSQNALSVDRLIQIIYLADWKYSITYGRQITDVHWRIEDFEPWMDRISIKTLVNSLAKIRVGVLLPISKGLSSSEKEILLFVIETSFSKENDEFNRLVYSTHPAIVGNNLDTALDFSELAKNYNQSVTPLLRERA